MKTNHIYNENCLETMKRTEDNFVDFVITSPPYNRKRNDKYIHYEDTQTDLEYKDFLRLVITELVRITKETVFFNIQATYYNRQIVYELIGEFAPQIQNILVWTKTNPMPNGIEGSVLNACEYIICLSKKPTLKAILHNTYNHLSTNVCRNPYKKIHRAVMHSEAVDYLLYSFIPKNSLVYDPFMGVGTTAERCLLYGARYIGSELSKEYCEVIEDRLSALIGYVSEEEPRGNQEEVSLRDLLNIGEPNED